ncbi:hypothetical protein POM88_006507 [Heracleum sosnowskyi]|uniref:Uncharacterized protein n=1 Tax=Heracleum sosnowskyi TaxID=360622 RepID=A0AAD8J4E3_9APIA|nr:hypothetical protein POM88_006507 [Heracleum sosnowskyi]
MLEGFAISSEEVKGNKVQLLTNHFKFNVTNADGHFFHYSVAFYEDGHPVDGKGIGREVLDHVHDTYKAELGGKDFAYDGENSLFTAGALPRNKLEFTSLLEDISSNRSIGRSSPRADWSPDENERKRPRRSYQSKTYKVEMSYAAKIPMQAIAQALRGQGCLVRQSFFHDDVNNFSDVGGGVIRCGFLSSCHTTEGGLSPNIDMSNSTTMTIQPGPVVDFLIANQNAKDPLSLDRAKAKNLRVKNSATNIEYKITLISDKICKELMFSVFD